MVVVYYHHAPWPKYDDHHLDGFTIHAVLWSLFTQHYRNFNHNNGQKDYWSFLLLVCTANYDKFQFIRFAFEKVDFTCAALWIMGFLDNAFSYMFSASKVWLVFGSSNCKTLRKVIHTLIQFKMRLIVAKQEFKDDPTDFEHFI